MKHLLLTMHILSLNKSKRKDNSSINGEICVRLSHHLSIALIITHVLLDHL